VVESEIGMGAQRKLDGIIPDDAGAPKSGGGSVMIRTRKKTIVPRSTSRPPTWRRWPATT
jgi:hypothetical protein